MKELVKQGRKPSIWLPRAPLGIWPVRNVLQLFVSVSGFGWGWGWGVGERGSRILLKVKGTKKNKKITCQ